MSQLREEAGACRVMDAHDGRWLHAGDLLRALQHFEAACESVPDGFLNVPGLQAAIRAVETYAAGRVDG